MKVGVIIPAAGSGARMGGRRKAFLELSGKPLLQHCLDAFQQIDFVQNIVVALAAEDAAAPPAWLQTDRITIVPGGSERAESVRAGLSALPDEIDVVVVHDAARPLVTAEMIRQVVDLAGAGMSATVAMPVTDTLHRVDAANVILETPDRSQFWRAQTPQAFPRETLKLVYARSPDITQATDEAGLVAGNGFPVKVVPGAAWNLKITTPEDILLAEAALARRKT